MQNTSRNREERRPFPNPWLSEQPFETLRVSRETLSADGWTRKVLLRLVDDLEVEAVLMGYPGRMTACLSSQVGCAMGCVFCATGTMGLTRHLRAGEIVAQAFHLAESARALGGQRLRNVVLMGMGEPLHNWAAVDTALTILNHPLGCGIGARHITVSTIGIVPTLAHLAARPEQFGLALSLHATTSERRRRLMPVEGKYDLEQVLEIVRRKPPLMHLILTGRGAHTRLIEMADTVSEVREIKHAFREDVEPQPGIDY